MVSLRSTLSAALVLSVLLPGCGEGTQPPPPDTSPFGPLGDRTDLPVDERLELQNLDGPVDVVRDDDGRTHIFATTLDDALRAEGYLVARDRAVQLEIFRRVAEGRMAQMLGNADDSLIDTDIAFRTIGLGRVAQAQWDAVADPELKDALLAFSDGVTQHFQALRAGTAKLSTAFVGVEPSVFTDWTPVDSLAIGRLQTYLLSYSGSDELDAQMNLDAVRAAFPAADPDPLVQKRAGVEVDLFGFAPATAATTTDGYPGFTTTSFPPPPKGKPKSPAPNGPPSGPASGARAHVRELARAFVKASRKAQDLVAPEGFGSNNWAVSPAKSASGRALLASDPHLSLSAPSVFWPVSMEVRPAGTAAADLKVGGIAFPGIPGIILGHNENVAWGATVAGYDVTDVYAEELTPDGQAVVFQGQSVPIEWIDEPIEVAVFDPVPYKVAMVPHHGPIVPNIGPGHVVSPPDPATGALSIRWTGLEATNEIGAVFGLLRAKSVDEAQTALQEFGVGAQNWMLADTNGDILWTSHARVPMRDPSSFASFDVSTLQGNLPCLVLPGDGSAEWQDYLPDALVPWQKNPNAGYLSTANNDPIGDTLDGDPTNDTLPDGTPMFLACTFDIAFREERIHQLLEAASPLDAESMAAIQGDHRSALANRLLSHLSLAIDRGIQEASQPGVYPDLTALAQDPAFDATRLADTKALLEAWKTRGLVAASGMDDDTNEPLEAGTDPALDAAATTLFNVWVVRLRTRVLGDELQKAGLSSLGREPDANLLLRLFESDPQTFATYDAATLDVALWDDMTTPAVESRHERMLRALLDAFAWADTQGGTDALRWGQHHTLTFEALIPLFGKLSIPPSSDAVFPGGFPRPGDSFSVDACDYDLSRDVDQEPSFSYGHGPTQRFVIEMDPAGVKAYNALPGGAVWDDKSPHFRDQAELWRRNQHAFVPFVVDDVVAAAESRTVLFPPAP